MCIYDQRKKKQVTIDSFLAEYRIHPKEWSRVKSLAGCTTDSVQGVRGVGEITALKYFRGELGRTRKAYRAIVSPEGQALFRDNLPLVRLPFEGCPRLKLEQGERVNWNGLMKLVGGDEWTGRNSVSNACAGRS